MMGIPVHLNIEEIRKPELDAQLVAEGITQQLERRIMFRRAMKRAVQNTMRLGAQGVRINVSGRLNGAEIARMYLCIHCVRISIMDLPKPALPTVLSA